MGQLIFTNNVGVFGGGAPAPNLSDYAVYWPLTAESGFADLAGTNNLSDDGSGLTFSAWDGDGNTAANFDGFALATCPDAAELEATTNFTWAFWFKSSAAGANLIFNKSGITANHIEYDVELSDDGFVYFTCSNGTTTVSLTGDIALNDGNPHLVIVLHDVDNGQIQAYVDNVAQGSVALAGTVTSTGAFNLTDSSLLCQIRGLGKWNRVLTSGERSALWSAGPAVVLSAP